MLRPPGHAPLTDAQQFRSDETLSEPQHPGTFFEMGPDELERLKNAGYSQIGVAIALFNTSGEVLVIEHKGGPKVRDRALGVISETTMGRRQDGAVYPEPTIDTISRCIGEELLLDPTTIGAHTRLEASFTLSDWPNFANPKLGKILAVNIALLVDKTIVDRLAGFEGSDEAHTVHFIEPRRLLEMNPELVRPGTIECLESLGEAGLCDVSNLGGATLFLPGWNHDPDMFDIDLRAL